MRLTWVATYDDGARLYEIDPVTHFESSSEHIDRARVKNVALMNLSLIHISEPTRLLSISYAVFCHPIK